MTEVYVVTHYGCNSGAHDMWPPANWVFSDYHSAYEKYLKERPDINDKDNIAEVHKFEDGMEYTVQIPGYYTQENDCCAKRPEGALLRKVTVIEPETKESLLKEEIKSLTKQLEEYKTAAGTLHCGNPLGSITTTGTSNPPILHSLF